MYSFIKLLHATYCVLVCLVFHVFIMLSPQTADFLRGESSSFMGAKHRTGNISGEQQDLNITSLRFSLEI